MTFSGTDRSRGNSSQAGMVQVIQYSVLLYLYFDFESFSVHHQVSWPDNYFQIFTVDLQNHHYRHEYILFCLFVYFFFFFFFFFL